MLALFRKKHQGLKWILWLVILTLGAGMLLLFVDTPTGIGQGLESNQVAMVDGNPITVAEFHRSYARLYEVYRQTYKLDQQDPEIVKQLGIGQRTISQLIGEYAILAEAQKLNIQTTPQEIARHISTYPVFQNNGQFVGVTQYERILQANHLTVQEFEANTRRELLRRKLMSVLTDGILITPDEVLQEFANRNQQVKVRYISIDTENMVPDRIGQEELREFFEERREAYRKLEQRKIKFVRVPIDPERVEVTEDQIQSRLADVTDTLQVRARHILVRVPDEAQEAVLEKKARRILKEARSGKDFGQLARQYSEDTASSQAGGDLGFFGRGKMVPEFEEVAFSLQPGQISDLVRSPFGFHIIQVVEAPHLDANQRRPIAEFQLRQELASQQAKEVANQISRQLKSGTSLEEAAQSHDLAVRESDYFGLADPIPGLYVRSDFNQRVFNLTKGQTTDPYSATGTYLVAELLDIRPLEMARFEDVLDRIREDYRSGKGHELAREKAFQFSRISRQEDRFEELSKEEGLPLTTTGFFKKGATIDDTLKFSPLVHDRAFTMDIGEISPPVQVARKYVVFQVVQKSQLDERKLEAEKAKLGEELGQQKRDAFFQSYIQNVIEQLRNQDRITVNQELLDALTS